VSVELDWSLWCSRHLEPLRAKWPEGAVIAMVELFKAAAADDRVIAAAGGDADNLTAVLHVIAPVCCYLGDAVVAQIMAAAAPTPSTEGPEPKEEL